MKHDVSIVVWLILLFSVSQIMGLFLISLDIKEISQDRTTGEITVDYQETAIGPRPETKGAGSFIFLAIGITIGTLLLLILVHFKSILTWKVWFFFATSLALTIAFGVFLGNTLAFLLAIALALWKLLKPNVIIHNLTEIFMYAGIALFLVPIFDLLWGILLLLAISAYDMYAVWKSKHMIKMAKFLGESKSFAGLFIPYTPKDKPKHTKLKAKKTSHKKIKAKHAILGGGDIVFPLLFAGVILEWLITLEFSKVTAFFISLIIPVFATIALAYLFGKSQKDTFYPAMPFLTAGCFVGGIIVFIIQLFL